MGKAEITFTIRFSAHCGGLTFPPTPTVIPSKRSVEVNNDESRTKRAKETVECAKAITEEQKVILDRLGKARVVVDSIQAILSAVGEVSQLHTIDANFVHSLTSYILLRKPRALHWGRCIGYGTCHQ